MIPNFFIAALVMTLVLAGIIVMKQYDIKSRVDKNILFLLNLFIYSLFGVSWSFVLFNGVIAWWSILISIIIGALTSFVIASILEVKDVNVGLKYKVEDLIGKRGIIVSSEIGKQYLGKLLDAESTGIIVKIEEDCNVGDAFEIVKIDNNEIVAKKVE